MTDTVHRTASDLAAAIRAGEISASEVVAAFLERIAAHNPTLNAVVTLDEAGATERARQADEALANGEIWGPLHGVPVTIKDMFETAGLRTTAGHPPFADNIPDQDATVVARLRRAGAVVLGKTNVPELGMDIQSDNPIFGATKNPWDFERTPGGSSGGEAAALAAAMTPLGVGSDIGGSMRIPAHYCGVFALKPTEGRVPNSGHIFPGSVQSVRHLAVSGPMARSVADLRLCLQVIAGADGRDFDTAPASLETATPRPVSEYRFAWTDDFGGLPVSADTRAAMTELADNLTRAGCRVERVSPPAFDFESVWKIYGELYGAIAGVLLPPVVRVLVRALGRFVVEDTVSRAGARLATASLTRYFRILEQRDELIGSLERFLADYDGWLCPVSSTPAFRHRKMGKIHTPIDVDGEQLPGNIAGVGYTCAFNLTGNPVVVAPIARSRDGLPIGVQVVGRRWGEMPLLNAAETLANIAGPCRQPPGY